MNPRHLALLAERGIEPATTPPAPFDPIAWRLEQAEGILARTIPGRFPVALVDDPDVRRWVDAFLADSSAVPSLVLSGPTGSGKSWLMWAALRSVVTSRARRGEGMRFRVTSHPELNDRLRPKSDSSHEWALEPFLSAELVLLDDLGAGKQTDWTGDSLYRLVDHRWANRLPTIFTTNLVPAALGAAVGERVLSRLGDAIQVTVKGKDRRWAA